MTGARVLVVNAGSSSVKLHLLDGHDQIVATRDLDTSDGLDTRALTAALHALGPADAVGHRVVHGGATFTAPAVIDDRVLATLDTLVELAPLHQPAALALIRAAQRARPDAPHVACFDTAFHAALPAASATYPVPAAWRDELHVRRYGFHGLSHEWAAARGSELAGTTAAAARIVSCHLGAGASLCAIDRGRSVDTTMGFTPLDGLVMATRSGALDPGLVTWLVTHAGIDAHEVEDALTYRSGLLALAGSGDMRVVTQRASAGEPTARLALDVYLHRVRGLIASMAAAMGGVDVLVFTGGVGEHATVVRAEAAAALAFLGVAIDADRNERATGDADITAAAHGGARTVVVTSREDVVIARQVRAALA